MAWWRRRAAAQSGQSPSSPVGAAPDADGDSGTVDTAAASANRAIDPTPAPQVPVLPQPSFGMSVWLPPVIAITLLALVGQAWGAAAAAFVLVGIGGIAVSALVRAGYPRKPPWIASVLGVISAVGLLLLLNHTATDQQGTKLFLWLP